MPAKKQGSNGRPRSMPEQTRRLLSHFNHEDRVLVTIIADPDALASALAIKRLLWRKVASVTIANNNEIGRPDNRAMVRLLNIPLEPLGSIKPGDFSKLVLVDGQPAHHEDFGSLKYNVIIDHHPLIESSCGVDFVDIRPRYGATSSILTEYLRAARIKPSARLATALIYGIKTDTSNFQRPALDQDVQAFQFLRGKANNSVLQKIEFSEMRTADLAVLREALDRVKLNKKTAFAHLGKVANPDQLVQIADFFLRVDSVDGSAVSGIFQDKLVVIVRAAGLRANAGKLAGQAFGALGSAGGHKSMARAEIPLRKLAEFLGDLEEGALARFVTRRIEHPKANLKRQAAAIKPVAV